MQRAGSFQTFSKTIKANVPCQTSGFAVHGKRQYFSLILESNMKVKKSCYQVFLRRLGCERARLLSALHGRIEANDTSALKRKTSNAIRDLY